jgi:hypothetical protein
LSGLALAVAEMPIVLKTRGAPYAFEQYALTPAMPLAQNQCLSPRVVHHAS